MLRLGLRLNRLPLITATFRHCDKRGGQVVGRGSVSNYPPFVIDPISYIQGIESGLREIFRKLIWIRKGIKECFIIFSLKTVTDDFAFIICSQRCAIGTLGRRNPSDLIAVLRECCGRKANRADQSEGFQHEEHS